MAGTICIYRLTNTTNTTEASVTDKVEFDGNAATPDAKSHISTFKVTQSIVSQENPNPDSNNPNTLQDTGLAIMQYEITGYFDEKSGDASAITTFRNWLREDKTNSDYTFGRFGIRNDNRTEFNTKPTDVTTKRGLILEHFETNEDYEYIGRVPFVVRLRYNGDITGLGV